MTLEEKIFDKYMNKYCESVKAYRYDDMLFFMDGEKIKFRMSHILEAYFVSKFDTSILFGIFGHNKNLSIVDWLNKKYNTNCDWLVEHKPSDWDFLKISEMVPL